MGGAPTEFGPYLLVSKLGHGGMGEAFLALTRSVGDVFKPWVVKRLHPYYLDEPAFIAMFMDEARLAARLSHPNVVHTTDVGEVDGLYYLTMEYLEGRSLDQVFRRARDDERPVPHPVLARMACDALAGLHYAHELTDYDGQPLHVVHRDISPGNLFVTSNGIVKLLDFGIAKASIQQAKTQTGSIKGKVEYMAPEQILGPKVDRRADIWSMGVLLFQAMTGISIFKGPSDVETLRKVTDASVDELFAILEHGDLPEGLVRVVGKGLQRDLDQRYATAEAMRKDIAAYLEGTATTHQDVADYVQELFGDEITQQRAKLGRLIADPESGRLSSPDPALSSQPPTVPDLPTAMTAMTAVAQPRRPITRPKRTVRRILSLAIILSLCVGAWVYSQGLFQTASSGRSALVSTPHKDNTVVDKRATLARETARGAERPEETISFDSASNGLDSTVSPDPAPDTTAANLQVDEHTESGSANRREHRNQAASRRAEHRRPRQRGDRRASPVATTEPQVGFLTVDSVPWTTVRLAGRVLGTTPLLGVELPPGEHRLHLQNTELGLERTETIRITAGTTTRRRIVLED